MVPRDGPKGRESRKGNLREGAAARRGRRREKRRGRGRGKKARFLKIYICFKMPTRCIIVGALLLAPSRCGRKGQNRCLRHCLLLPRRRGGHPRRGLRRAVRGRRGRRDFRHGQAAKRGVHHRRRFAQMQGRAHRHHHARRRGGVSGLRQPRASRPRARGRRLLILALS
ncbi:hypothetical protein M885DRAFT_325324 [Pelagophyceae sp. CCMP2097]|nr:hypothetical protein M885DRAFT_325324 [Pelagophyceae sp. CCMP2097]